MWPSHFNYGLTKREHFLCVDEDSTKFRLRCRRHNKLDYLRNSEERTVETREGVLLGEKYVGDRSTASFGFIVESSIIVGGNNHAASAVGDDVSGVGGNITK